MSVSKPNLKFNYLYRDAGNYKNFGSVVFSNPHCFTIEKITDLINDNLIDNEFFYHDKFGVPPLFFNNQNTDDITWHEFENLEFTDDKPTSEISIADFLSNI
jgi:hypothetical protein